MHFGVKKKSFFGIHLKDTSRDSTRTSTNESIDSKKSASGGHEQDHRQPVAQATSAHDSQSTTRSNTTEQNNNGGNNGHQSSSMLELKRFFRPSKKPSRPASPSATPSKRNLNDASASVLNLAVHDEQLDEGGILAKKYGNMGKILGSGVGGSVRLLVRPSDGVTFAVKEFRPRRPNEAEKDYAKKCTAEFCIGSTLHHPNIIQTLDITHEKGHYFEVMEYCPVDFFAVVMSGKMLRGEINCCFRQICEGVKYLHSMGIAHRDLKLDNCVMTADGILKVIDFGSAVVFRYPFEEELVKAHGICGSDPYLAPEVLTHQRYDAQPVDIWSIGIIYCCMTLKRFPWKAPKHTDPSFKLYNMPDDEQHDYEKAASAHKELLRRKREEKKKNEEAHNEASKDEDAITDALDKTHLDERKGEAESEKPKEEQAEKHTEVVKPEVEQKVEKKVEKKQVETNSAGAVSSVSVNDAPAKATKQDSTQRAHHHQIHGPYRLMRLLPHAARPVISRMLAVDPKARATFEDIFNDSWFSEIVPCTQDSKGKVVHAPGHIHTEVKEEEAHLESYKEKAK